MAQDLYREFRAAVDRPEHAIDLGYAALTIGLSAEPHLDVSKYLRRIDQLAREVGDRRDPAGDVYHGATKFTSPPIWAVRSNRLSLTDY